eukprot:g6520.t1
MSGNKLELSVNPSDTLRSVREKITKFALADQKLIFQGQPLNLEKLDSVAISSIKGVSDGSVLHIIRKLHSSSDSSSTRGKQSIIINVVCPNGVHPGSILQVTVPGKRQLVHVRVPSGVVPGQAFQVEAKML